MAEQMYVVTMTQDEWTYLDRLVKNSAGVPESLRFALDSATIAQKGWNFLDVADCHVSLNDAARITYDS